LNQQQEAAPDVQDDFELTEGQMKDVELKDQDEVKVLHDCSLVCTPD
jgi:hypothetical protein